MRHITLHPNTPQQGPASKLTYERQHLSGLKEGRKHFAFFWLPAGENHSLFSFWDCFYIDPACDVPGQRHKQVRASNEGKTPLQTQGPDFSLLVYFLWLWWFVVNSRAPSNRRNRGKGKGASPLARSAPLLARNSFLNRNPWYRELLGKLRWGLKGVRQMPRWTPLSLAGFEGTTRLRRVTGPWHNPGTVDPAWNLEFISPGPQTTERQARQA